MMQKDSPDFGDVHVSSSLEAATPKRRRRRRAGVMVEEVKDDSMQKRFDVTVMKILPDKRQMFGWMSVSTRNGMHVIDKQGDVIPIEALEPAVYEYVLSSRDGGDMHVRKGVMQCIESMMFTKEKQDLLGIDLGMEGWWGGFLVDDPELWAAVKRGERPEFSIGGAAMSKDLEEVS